MQAPKLWSFSFALVGAVACFLASTLYAQHEETAITDLSRSISENAMPSIEHLATARTELRHIDALVDDYIDNTGAQREAVLAAMHTARRAVDENISAYLALPIFPGEEKHWTAIKASLARVDAALLQLRTAVASENPPAMAEAATEMTTACDDATDAAGDDIEFNAQEAAALSSQIAMIHERSARVAYALDAVSSLLALVFAFISLRVIASHMRLVREKNALLEERADELELFAGRVAHDIRNPLNGVRLVFGQLARHAPDERTSTAVARGERGVDRALHLLDGLLSFAQAAAHPSPDSHAVVGDVVDGVLEDVQPLAAEAGVELRCFIERECAVAMEPTILEVLVSNLVRNAIRYIGDGPEKLVVVRAASRDHVTRIEVEDSGVGIPREQRSRIFEPFVRGPSSARDRGGIGLGLATVHKICDAHHGRVWVEARRDDDARGSRFCVELPSP